MMPASWPRIEKKLVGFGVQAPAGIQVNARVSAKGWRFLPPQV